MKKWYQSPLCKGILLLISHISAVVLAVCVGIGFIYPGQNYGQLFWEHDKSKYEDTRGFSNELENKAWEILHMSNWKKVLCTNGKYNPKKILDVEVFEKTGNVKENPGEFSFYLEDLLGIGANEKNVLVCQSPKERLKYRYLTKKEFVEEAKKNSYSFPEKHQQGYTMDEVLDEILSDGIAPDGEVLNSKGEQVYSSVWFMDQMVYGELKTAQGKTLIQLANESEKWNGRLNEMVQSISNVSSEINDFYSSYVELNDSFSIGETNISYLYVDYDNKQIENNLGWNIEDISLDVLGETEFEAVTQQGKYVYIAPTLAECKTNLSSDNVSLSAWKRMVSNSKANSDHFRFVISVDTNYPIQDSFYERNQTYLKFLPWAEKVIGFGCMAAGLFIISIIWLTVIAGKSNYHEGIALFFFDRWKTEIWLGLMGMILLATAFPLNFVDGYVYNWDQIIDGGQIKGEALIVFGVSAAGMCFCIMTAYLSVVRVLKAKTFWKNSITRMFCLLIRYIWENRSSLTKLIIAGVGLFLINFMVLTGNGFFVLLAMAIDVMAILYLAKMSVEKTRIKKGIMKIAAGDTDYKIPLDNLTHDSREMAEMVNHIGEGIQNAVEKSLKDERLKTDLITNVSHDIKTPLTSIINYVGLLKQEHFEDPKVQRYLDILDQKSQRLKTLTEDVVEASKISSGNINLEFINLNLVEMIHQTTGEFTEKFEKRNLTAVVNVPNETALVRVDGRRMWRVIENVYNNAAKYAMPGTRVYVDLSADKNLVVLSLKNVSEYPLNISADELMERFTRGDVSRTTEGSGLGLSIAQNLTKMQGGEFKISIDGDLFKVMISFPRIYPKVEKPVVQNAVENLENKPSEEKEKTEEL